MGGGNDSVCDSLNLQGASVTADSYDRCDMWLRRSAKIKRICWGSARALCNLVYRKWR